MTPRSPNKPNKDPETGRTLPKSSHGPKHTQGAANSPQARTLSPGALELYEQAQSKEPVIKNEEIAELTEEDLIHDPESIGTLVVLGNRRKLKILLEKIKLAPKEGISNAIVTWRRIIGEAAQMPDIAPELKNAVQEQITILKRPEASLDPSDRVALGMFVKSLEGQPSEKKEEESQPTPSSNPFKFVGTWEELVNVTQQLLQEAETTEDKNKISRSVIEKALELALKSEDTEEWSEWGEHLFSHFPRFQENGILTSEEIQKYCEIFIHNGINKMKDSLNALKIMKWNTVLKAKLEMAQKTGLIKIELAMQTLAYIDHLRATKLETMGK